MTSGHTAELGEQDKHFKKNIPCAERGWVCVPMVVGAIEQAQPAERSISTRYPHAGIEKAGLLSLLGGDNTSYLCSPSHHAGQVVSGPRALLGRRTVLGRTTSVV